MIKYINKTPFQIIIETNTGPKYLNPNEHIEVDFEIHVPGVEMVGGISDKDLKSAPTDIKPFGEAKKIDLFEELNKKFNGRFKK